MDYILTTVLIILGVLYMVMQEVKKLRRKYPDFSFKKIWGAFFTQEWDTLGVCFLCWLTFELILFILRYKHIKLPGWYEFPGMYILAITWGYAGVRLAYKYLGTTEAFMEKKADSLKANTN